MKKFNFSILLSLLICVIAFSSCGDDEPVSRRTDTDTDTNKKEQTTISTEIKNATHFAKEVAEDVYLWIDEIGDKIDRLDTDTCTDPVSTWSAIRYKNGDYEDKWSRLLDDFESFNSSVEGIETTYGWNVSFYYVDSSRTNVCFVVNFVYPNSPAANAGIQRGDVILTYNGKAITESNYQTAYYSASGTWGFGHGVATVQQTTDLTAIKMYLDPIICTNVFDINGKKVGYLHYASFDLASIPNLIEVSKQFKTQGVTELILDLRYNGGGYVVTEEAMSAMYAPWSNVAAKDVFHTEIWNSRYMNYYKNNNMEEDLKTRFSTTCKVDDVTYDLTEANIGLTKIYAIITESSASASESLLVGLMPFMDVEIIGTQSHGKYCTGYMLSTETWYKNFLKTSIPTGLDNWGFYIMVSRYADKNGNNPCMPNGLTPDFDVEDDPTDGCQLGDENETMLAAALEAAGKVTTKAFRNTGGRVGTLIGRTQHSNFGLRIDNRSERMMSIINKKINEIEK